MKRLRPRLTYANVTASIAVFLVLGGGAYAATRLPKNSVKSVNIAPGQVKRPDIAGNAINTGKVADGGLTAADFAAGQLPQGARGEQGYRARQGRRRTSFEGRRAR